MGAGSFDLRVWLDAGVEAVYAPETGVPFGDRYPRSYGMPSEKVAQAWANRVLYLAADTEESELVRRRMDVLSDEEFAPVVGTPRKIVGEQGTRDRATSAERKGYHKRPTDNPTSLGLPKGYYEARIEMNKKK